MGPIERRPSEVAIVVALFAAVACSAPASALQFRAGTIPSAAAAREAEQAALPRMSGERTFTVITRSKAASDVAKLAAYFRSRGFAVQRTPVRHNLRLRGTYAHVPRAFPAAIAPLIAGTSFEPGLRALPQAFRPLDVTHGPSAGYAPSDIASVYDIAPSYAAGLTGAGTNVAIAACSSVQPSDLAHYDAQYGLPAPNVHFIPIDGTTTYQDGEATLDVERVHGTAPGATIYEYLAPDCADSQIIDMFAQIAEDTATYHFAAVSHSYGSFEADYAAIGDENELQSESAAIGEVVSQGVPVFAASGDNGAWGTIDENQTDVLFPASDTNVVSVGATTLEENAAGGRLFEYAWAGSGGGVSADFPIPGFARATGAASFTYKNLPDLAMVGDPYTGVAEYWAANDYGMPPLFAIGGTSVSTPTFAGIWALVDQALARAGRGNAADAGELIYANPAAFTDITAGANGYYKAGPGYDNVTGLGVPDVGKLIAAVLATRQAPAPAPTAAPHPRP